MSRRLLPAITAFLGGFIILFLSSFHFLSRNGSNTVLPEVTLGKVLVETDHVVPDPEPSGPFALAGQVDSPFPNAFRELIFEEGRKHPWRIQETINERVSTFIASQVLVCGADPVQLADAGYKVNPLGAGIFLVGWNEISVEAFEKHRSLIQECFPEAYVEPDYFNHKSAWLKGERAVAIDAEDRIGQKWIYDNGINANGFVVAVIDSGINAQHPELAGGLFINPDETLNGIDDDGNGLVDDTSGWDFLNNDNDPEDIDGHGTKIAGILAADGSNGEGMAGIAPGCQILPIKFLDEYGDGLDSEAIQAIDYARRLGIKIINASWGREGEATFSMRRAIENFTSTGGLFITSAGNNGADIDATAFSPASLDLPGIIVVGGSRRDYLGRDTGSNYGRVSVDILAPFEVLTIAPDSSEPWQSNGTSFSAAVVSALTAVLWKNYPGLSSSDIKDRLLKTAIFIPNARETFLYPGHPDFRRMLEDIRSPKPVITGYSQSRDPVHPGEWMDLIFEVEGDAYFQLSGVHPRDINQNRIQVLATLEPIDYHIEIHALLGSFDFGTVTVQATPSAPYLERPLPKIFNLEELEDIWLYNIEDAVRGDRPFTKSWFLNGIKQNLYSSLILKKSPTSAGSHKLLLSNVSGETEIELTALWKGRLPVYSTVPAPMPFESARFVLTTATGAYATNEQGTFFSENLLDWHSISPNRTGLAEVEGIVYMMDQDGLFAMDGGERAGQIAEGVDDEILGLQVKGGYFMVNLDDPRGVRDWMVLHEGTWKLSVSDDSLVFNGESSYPYLDPDTGLWVYLTSHFNPSSGNPILHLNGFSITFVDGSYDVMIMEDALKLSESAYTFLPHAAYSGRSGWFNDPVLGWFQADHERNSMWSVGHGWLHYFPSGDGTAYLYKADLGWLYFDPDRYPILYSWNMAAWVYLNDSGNGMPILL
jgi:subtilisin family serine protease